MDLYAQSSGMPDLLAGSPSMPNPQQGLSLVFAEYYLMYAAFEWISDLYEMVRSFFQAIVDMFTFKEQYDF